ncbi:hypothetical protein [Mycobacterium uberis]|uniref:hypothetical protein n=1 Tax=Mycobacterium uberis TaxID=2162698 RepID=UPI000E308A3A|nr:hypothetical protein [Mycobacterium uberis]
MTFTNGPTAEHATAMALAERINGMPTLHPGRVQTGGGRTCRRWFLPHPTRVAAALSKAPRSNTV